MIRIDVDCRTSSAWPAGWRYWPGPTEGLLEIGTLHGSTFGLATHFHDETQITFVRAGRRRMTIGGQAVAIEAGRCACIPAGVPHGDFGEPTDVSGFIAYAAPGAYNWSGLAADIEDLWRENRELPWTALAAIVANHRRPRDGDASASWDLPSSETMSREGFSRLFRRRIGMPPHAFEVAGRLNAARRRLRRGEPIADVAAATGFSDQSHLGRLFRRAYGVTPGVYGRGHRVITNVPDA